MKTKRFFVRLILVFALAFGFAIALEGFVYAQELSVNLHTKVEASSDNGATWHNYSGTEFSGGETITASPGDTILVRLKIWNSATTWYVTNLTGAATTTNSSYIQTATITSADYDGNTNPYIGYFFDGTGAGAIATVLQSGSENGANCESLLASFTLSNDFPVGETVITAQATIGGYTENEVLVGENEVLVGLLDKLGIAKAAGTGRNSTARIAVNVAATPTATATATTSSIVAATATETAAALPQTGADTNGQNTSGYATSIASLIALALIYRLFRTIKKSA